MARSYQIPGGPLINAAQDSRSYALPGYGHFNDETAVAAGGIISPLTHSMLLTNGPLIRGRLVG